jgi:hypothetical protein
MSTELLSHGGRSRGQRDIRRLLVLGAMSVVRWNGRNGGKRRIRPGVDDDTIQFEAAAAADLAKERTAVLARALSSPCEARPVPWSRTERKAALHDCRGPIWEPMDAHGIPHAVSVPLHDPQAGAFRSLSMSSYRRGGDSRTWTQELADELIAIAYVFHGGLRRAVFLAQKATSSARTALGSRSNFHSGFRCWTAKVAFGRPRIGYSTCDGSERGRHRTETCHSYLTQRTMVPRPM